MFNSSSIVALAGNNRINETHLRFNPDNCNYPNHLPDPGKMVNPQTMKSTLLNNTNCPAIPVGTELTYLRPAFDGDWYGYKGKEYIILKQHIHGSTCGIVAEA